MAGPPLRLLLRFDVDGDIGARHDILNLIASVAYFPAKYGDGPLRLALDLLTRRPVHPAVFTSHQIIPNENVDRFYPTTAC